MVGNRSGYGELYYCDIDGANLKQVTQDKSIVWLRLDRWRAFYPYTPYKRVIQIFIRREERMRYLIGGLNTGAALSPDGRYLAVCLTRGKSGTVSSRGSEWKIAKTHPNTYSHEASPTWSPDGSKLAYVSDRRGIHRSHPGYRAR